MTSPTTAIGPPKMAAGDATTSSGSPKSADSPPASAIGRRLDQGTLRPGTSEARVNVGDLERLGSAGAGVALALFGLSRGSLAGMGLAAVGGGLLYRGLTGHCHMYGALGVNTAGGHGRATSVAAGHGVKVEHAVTVNKPASELFAYWRNFENLPRVMRHLKSVTVQGDKSHWVAEGPLGRSVEWDAEIINERPNALIAWRSLEGSDIDCAGSVHFTPAGGGTEVRVSLKYDPPGGQLGGWLAWLTGQEPTVQVRDDLENFKRRMEAGELSAAGRR